MCVCVRIYRDMISYICFDVRNEESQDGRAEIFTVRFEEDSNFNRDRIKNIK